MRSSLAEWLGRRVAVELWTTPCQLPTHFGCDRLLLTEVESGERLVLEPAGLGRPARLKLLPNYWEGRLASFALSGASDLLLQFEREAVGPACAKRLPLRQRALLARLPEPLVNQLLAFLPAAWEWTAAVEVSVRIDPEVRDSHGNTLAMWFRPPAPAWALVERTPAPQFQ